VKLNLLIIPKEYLNRQPSIPTNLHAIWDSIQLLNLLRRQLPAIELKIRLNPVLVHRLRDDRPALLQTPCKQNLCGGLAFLFGDGSERCVFDERRVGAAEARIASRVDTLGGVVGDELGGRVVGVQLDLVDGWDDLGRGVVEENLQVLDSKIRDTDIPDFAGGGQLLQLLPCLDEVPVGEMF